MPDPQPKPPTPLKRFALQRPPLAPPGTVRIDAAPPPPNFSPWQLWGQGLLETVVDPIRGAFAGASGPEDTLAAKAGELFATLPPIAGAKQLLTGRGLYSRVDEALKLLPKKGAHPNKIATILKNHASTEELAYRGVPAFLASQGNATVTPADLAAHLAAHPAPVPNVKTLGGPNPARLTELPEGYSIQPLQGSPRFAHTLVYPDGSGRGLYGETMEDALDEALGQLSEGAPRTTPTKFQRSTLPGGEGYRETLVTLPTAKQFDLSKVTFTRDRPSATQGSFEVFYEGKPLGRFQDDIQLREGRWEGRTDDQIRDFARRRFDGDVSLTGGFRSSHFDEPNLLVHTRSNERTLPTGERGRFVEEVQSDWHQAGKQKGYQQPPVTADTLTLREGEHSWMVSTPDGRQVEVGKGTVADATEARAYAQRYFTNRAQETPRVPDAPFKESWPDLGLKQQVLETAADPHAQWIGFTSGQTQAARYDLSKQISRVEYSPKSGPYLGSVRAYDLDGNRVLEKFAEPGELPDLIGKEAAEKLLQTPPRQGLAQSTQILEGVDLQVGGEGMRHFYDQVLPKRLEKIVKPFGGTVEKAPLGGRTKAEIDAEMDAILERASASEGTITERYSDEVNRQLQVLQAERNKAHDGAPAWIAKLTPAMKARILKEGLPLLSLTAFLAQMGQPAPKETR